MSETPTSRLWLQRAGFTALAMVILFGHLLPLQTVPRSWAWPDFLICIGMCWSARRPEVVPLALLAVIFLLADFLLQRPPGLWAALAVWACAHVQARARVLHSGGFITEWARVAILIVAIAMIWRGVLVALMVPMPGLAPFIIQTVLTIIAYPAVVGFCTAFLGLRHSASTELDSFGVRT